MTAERDLREAIWLACEDASPFLTDVAIASLLLDMGHRWPAQGTEAGTAATPKIGAVHDGPVPNGNAPKR